VDLLKQFATLTKQQLRMSKEMKGKRGSRAGKIRGIYRRGNIFWFASISAIK